MEKRFVFVFSYLLLFTDYQITQIHTDYILLWYEKSPEAGCWRGIFFYYGWLLMPDVSRCVSANGGIAI